MPLDSTMILLLIPIGVLQLGLQVFGLIDLFRRDRQTRGPKGLWAVLIIFGSLIGSVLYFAVGRDTRSGGGEE